MPELWPVGPTPRGGSATVRVARLAPRQWGAVVLRADRGAAAIGSATVVRGAANVARQASAFSRLDIDVRPALVNSAAGTVTLRDGRRRRIAEMDVLADPERLSQLDLTILG